jgi:hypothetical protein
MRFSTLRLASILFVVSAVFSFVNAQAALQETLDQEQPSSSYNFTAADQWQSFTSGVGAYISRISIYGGTQTEAKLTIYEGEGPSGRVLQKQTIVSHPTLGWLDVTVKNPIRVDIGAQYTFRIETPPLDPAILSGDTANPYRGGRHSSGSGNDLAFEVYVTTEKATKTLVVFLTRSPGTDISDLSGVRQALETELYGPIEQMSFGRAFLDVTYAGPYVGEIANCTTSSSYPCSAIVNHAVDNAYSLDRIDVTQYENFIALRNYDFTGDDCFCAGNGGYGDTIEYDGGKRLTAGETTIAYPSAFTWTTFPQATQRTVHEFLHGYGRGTQHAVTLLCYTDPDNKSEATKVPYYYSGDEDVLRSPYCDRSMSSWLDVMGRSPDAFLSTNSITKLQYGWLKRSNVVTINFEGFPLTQEVTLKPVDTEDAIDDPQMILIPIPGTTKAYVLELRSNAMSGSGIYLYLMPNRHDLTDQEQYLLHTGEVYTDGTIELVAPMKRDFTVIDSIADFLVNVKSASTSEATVELFLGSNCPGDLDCDAVDNRIDNCPSAYNPLQGDWDGNGMGDACDSIPIQLIANAGPDQTVSVDDSCTSVVTLDGSGSSGSDGDSLTYNWTGSFGAVSGVNPRLTLGLGSYGITLSVSDGNAVATGMLTVTAVDTTPPVITNVSATPPALWPPNRQLVPVRIGYDATDNCDLPACTLAVVSSDPVDGRRDGETSDWKIGGPNEVFLRAERGGDGSGRSYSVTISCSDTSGNSSTATVPVIVPHDKRRRKE